MGLVVRILLLLGGVVAGIFVARDSHQYQILSMAIGVVLFTLAVAVVAYREPIKKWLRFFLRLDKGK